EPDGPIDERAVGVRPALDEGCAHRREPGGADGAAGGRDSADPAHPLTTPGRMVAAVAAPAELQLLLVLVPALRPLLLADRSNSPYPILLVVGGLALGFAPGVPSVMLPPDLVIIGILPPLLYTAAFNTGLRDLKRNIRAISLLAIVLVAVTMVAVAVAAHYVMDLSWSVAFVLGAVVSPTDPIAATSIAHRLGVPRRAIAIVEGESLVNDGSALVLFKFAAAAVVSGSFSLVQAARDFVWTVLGGIAVGLLIRPATRL